MLSADVCNLRNLRIISEGFRAFCRLLTAYCFVGGGRAHVRTACGSGRASGDVWWRRRELNSDPKVNAEGLYMLSCFSFRRLVRTPLECSFFPARQRRAYRARPSPIPN